MDGCAGSKLALVQTEVDILKAVPRIYTPVMSCFMSAPMTGIVAPPARPPQISHPYIVRCYDVVDTPDKMYFMMEL